MKIFNEKMYNLFKTLQFSESNLHENLLGIIASGFLNVDGCYVISALLKNCQSIGERDFVDKTGYECFVNSIHIDDYVDDEFLQQAFLMVEKGFEVWNAQNKSLPLVGLVSKTDFGANVKFYLQRPNEVYINSNEVDKFEDAIMLSLSN